MGQFWPASFTNSMFLIKLLFFSEYLFLHRYSIYNTYLKSMFEGKIDAVHQTNLEIYYRHIKGKR